MILFRFNLTTATTATTLCKKNLRRCSTRDVKDLIGCFNAMASVGMLFAMLASFIGVESYTSRSPISASFTKMLLPASLSKPTVSSATSRKTTSLFGIRSRFKNIIDSITNQEYNNDELKIGIAGFYDRSSLLWEQVWGEHMHHGYYIPENRTDHQQAQIDLIDQVLSWSGVVTSQNVIDVGCGIGGSSRHIAKKYPGAKVTGITLSPYQAQRATEIASEQNLSNVCSFQVADALQMPFPSESFDLVWSLESGEHMPNKTQFVNELFRVCQPSGKIIIVTWCHRNLENDEVSLTKRELKLLRAINRAYYLPQWCSVNDYMTLLQQNNATNIQYEDWSYIIAPFWKAVIRSSLNWKSVIGLIKAGFTTQRGAYAMLLMLRGYKKGLIKFGLLSCNKPASTIMKDDVDMKEDLDMTATVATTTSIPAPSIASSTATTSTAPPSSLNDMDLIDP